MKDIVEVVRHSPLTGEENIMTLDMSQAEFDARMDVWNRGELIQNAFPMLTPAEREFIKTGYTPEDWDKMFGYEDEDE